MQLELEFVAYSLGLFPESFGLQSGILLTRIDQAACAGFLPQTAADRMILELPDDASQRVPGSEIQQWLEDLPLADDLLVWRWAAVCQALFPEWYGDPPHGKKTSNAEPGSHAGLECLTRRKEAGRLLWHPRDKPDASSARKKRHTVPDQKPLRLDDPEPQADFCGRVPAWWPDPLTDSSTMFLITARNKEETE